MFERYVLGALAKAAMAVGATAIAKVGLQAVQGGVERWGPTVTDPVNTYGASCGNHKPLSKHEDRIAGLFS